MKTKEIMKELHWITDHYNYDIHICEYNSDKKSDGIHCVATGSQNQLYFTKWADRQVNEIIITQFDTNSYLIELVLSYEPVFTLEELL